MKRVLIIAAHPDDEVLGCGGLISKYRKQEINFKVIFVGEGSSCRFEEACSEESLAAIEERTKLAEQAMALLGIQAYEFHNLPCGRLNQVPIIAINKIIENAVREFNPDTVFTHSPFDANNDHKIVFDATLMATRPGAQNRVNRVFSFEVLSSSEWAFINVFKPNYFEELSGADLHLKWSALALYESEVKSFPFPRSNEGITALAMMRGMQSGSLYAEALHLVREIKS